MELRREEFPIALQAYEVRGESENFVAEQVVNTQVEADKFMSLYAGRLIKTRDVRPIETKHYAPAHRRRASAMPLDCIVTDHRGATDRRIYNWLDPDNDRAYEIISP